MYVDLGQIGGRRSWARRRCALKWPSSRADGSLRWPHSPPRQRHQRAYQIAFTIGVIALGAKMAKADGMVTRDEVIAFKEVFKVPEGEMENVSRIFNLAKQDVVGYEAYANQLASLLKGNRKLLEDVLEGLFHIAMADGVFHPNEEQFLADVAQRFGFTRTQFNYIKARHVSAVVKSDPYEVLGIAPDVDDETLRSTTTSWFSIIILTG